MKSKKKTAKKKLKGKSKKKAVKKTKKTTSLRDQNIHGGSSFQSFLEEQQKEPSPQVGEWLANNPDKWDPDFATDLCACEQPEKGCLDESDIHQDGICEDSDCKNEICLMERSLKAWEEVKSESKEFVLKQENFNRLFWDEEPKENASKGFWQKVKQFFGFGE